MASSKLMVIGKSVKKKDEYSFSSFAGAMLLAVAGLESFLNSMAYFVDDEKFCYNCFERRTIEDKIDFLLLTFNIDFKKGERPYQTVKQAVKWRNSLVHSKPTYVEETEISHGDDIRKLPAQHVSVNEYDPYENLVNEKNADRFNRDIIKIIETIKKNSGINPRSQCVYKNIS
jgi:hypothetical protein